MMNKEELKAKLAAVTTIEEAYALAKECGFTGTLEEFKNQATKADNETMDLDAMDAVAGGFGVFDAIDWFREKLGLDFPNSLNDPSLWIVADSNEKLDMRDLCENA